MSSPNASQPDSIDAAAVQSILGEACVGALPDWLEKRRWFADKGRGISGMAIEDALVERVGLDWLALTVARVAFGDGGAARYLLPLTLTESPGAADLITAAASSAGSGVIVDATEKRWFGGWLLDQFSGGTELARGAWVFAARAGVGTEIAAARSSPTTVVRAEQSNSSLCFGDILIVKLFRRLQPGLNPDEEVLRALAGPRVLEHIVDTVLYFEGDTSSAFRLVRAFKNRFGAVNELGVFAMTDTGLKGVSNPSAIFLSGHSADVPGSCVMVTQEGTRPLLVEIQALVESSPSPNPRRLSVGLEQNRLAMLLAVLHRHAGLACYDQDVFINAVGGVRINEPAADLPLLLAIVSSFKNKAMPDKLVVFGEVGLAGEIRPVQRGQERLKEAAKLGFTRAIVPAANKPRQAIAGMEVIAVERLQDAVAYLREQG